MKPMRRTVLLILAALDATALRVVALAALAFGLLPAGPALAQDFRARIVEQKFELIVELRDAALRGQLEKDLSKLTTARWRPMFPRATKKGAGRLAKFRRVEFGSAGDRNSARAYMRTHATVRGLERPEVLGRLLDCPPGETTFEPDDEYFNDPSGAPSSGAWGQAYEDQWGLRAIRAPEAWCEEQGDANLVVAVVDTGVHYKHLDFQDVDLAWRFWVNPDEDINNNQQFDDWSSEEGGDLDGIDGDPMNPATQNGYADDVIGVNLLSGETWDVSDDIGHGTSIAGIIGAATNNNMGIAGINHNSKLMVVRMDPRSLTSVAESIVYAVEHGAKVVTASWTFEGPPVAVVEAALDYAYANDVVVCVAAGNTPSESERRYPQSDPRVLNITAMNAQEEPTSFTSFGARTDVAAPGGGETEDTTEPNGHRNILSAVRNSPSSAYELVRSDPDFHFARWSGTSFAAPHAAGVVSLILSRNPGLGVEQVRQALRLGAVDIADPGWDPSTGPGRLDALNPLLLSDGPLGKARIFTPFSRSDISVGPLVRIRGTAWASSFDHYELMIAAGTDPAPAAWQTIGSGTTAVEDGLLLEWDPTPLGLPQGQYMLRLVVFGDGREYEDRMTVFVGPAVSVRNSLVVGTPPVVGNVDGDAAPEIVAFVSQFHHTLVVLSADGSVETTVELKNCSEAGSFLMFFGGPALGDLDTGSAGLEIALLEFGQVRVIHGDGTDVEGWPRPIDIDFTATTPSAAQYHTRVVLEDLDGDGQLELLAFRLAGGQYKLTAFAVSGDQLWEYVLSGGDPVEPGTIAVGDVTGPTADPEIVVLQGDGIVILDGNGVSVRTASLGLASRGERPSLALINLVGDPKLDIVASQSTDQGLSAKVWVLDGDLVAAAGWPQSVEPSGRSAISEVMTALAVGDVDGDLQPDIVVNLSDEIAVFGADGSELTANARFEEPGIMTPVLIADISGDGLPEVIATTATSGLRAFDLQNGDETTWDLPILDLPYASAVWDSDGDSNTELIAFQQGEQSILCGVAFDLRLPEETPGTGMPPWPMAHGGPRRTGSFPETSSFLRGDSNNDCERNIADASFTLGFLFLDTGDVPKCQDAVDTNNDGAMNVSDPQYLLNYLFLGGPPPPEPLDCPGVENPVEDALTCVTSTCPRCPAPCQPCP